MILKSPRSLKKLSCSWPVAVALLSGAAETEPLCAELERCGVESPAEVLDSAYEAQILVSDAQLHELEHFFDDWTWGPLAAGFLFGYETDSFPDETDSFLDGRSASGQTGLGGAGGSSDAGDSDSEHRLPVAPDHGLSHVVRRRRSRRSFADRPLDIAQLGACLQSAFAITAEIEYERGPKVQLTGAPTPGGVTSYDAFVLVRNLGGGYEPGTYRYVPERHALARVQGRPVALDLLFGGQAWCSEASCAIVLVADLRRQAVRYKFPTTIGAVLVEAGARVQLILLQAEELSLGAVVVGMTGVGAFDRQLAREAGLPCSTGMVMPACAVVLGPRSTN